MSGPTSVANWRPRSQRPRARAITFADVDCVRLLDRRGVGSYSSPPATSAYARVPGIVALRLAIDQPYARGAVAETTDPIVRFRLSLAVLRSWGLSFDAAWSLALPRPLPDRERVALRSALNATRDRWRAAWEGEPPTPAERVLAMLGPMPVDDALADRDGIDVAVRVG
jgi:hypothetical protein